MVISEVRVGQIVGARAHYAPRVVVDMRRVPWPTSRHMRGPLLSIVIVGENTIGLYEGSVTAYYEWQRIRTIILKI